MEKTKACRSIKPGFKGLVLETSTSSSKLLEKGPSPVSAKRLAAAHSAQMGKEFGFACLYLGERTGC